VFAAHGTAVGLRHLNIVPVYYFGCERGVHFYAMQYIEGQNLAALIRELRLLSGLGVAEEEDSAGSVLAGASELMYRPLGTIQTESHGRATHRPLLARLCRTRFSRVRNEFWGSGGALDRAFHEASLVLSDSGQSGNAGSRSLRVCTRARGSAPRHQTGQPAGRMLRDGSGSRISGWPTAREIRD
jgi:hypothetical protein